MRNRLFQPLIFMMVMGIACPSLSQIPVDDPAQFVNIMKDVGQSDIAQSIADVHDTYQEANQKIIGAQDAISKLTQKDGLEKTLLGQSNIIGNTFQSFGIDYTDPTKAMSNDTLNLLRSELVLPSTKEERAEMTEDALKELASNQAQNFQALAIQSLSEAWVAQTEAAAKAEMLSSIGQDIDNSLTQTDVLVSLIRISGETAAELNARSVIQSGNLASQSINTLRDVK